MRRITLVRKRDGRLVPFDLRRVADAIFEAARAVGGEDRFLAEELAGVVGLYLERTHAERIPSVTDVEDAVERVLVDTGHARTAKAFILHRDRRTAARERVLIEEDGGGERPLPLVGSDVAGGLSRWSKARVVAALLAEAGLDAPTAEEVARAVEARVLSSGSPRLPSSLVRALVDSELFARGHVRSLERQRVVGLPKHDLAARLEEGPAGRRDADPAAFLESLGEEVMKPFVLEEVLPAAAAEAHRVGDLHLYDLGAPFSATATAPASAPWLEACLRGEGVSRALGARRLVGALGEAILRGAGRVSRTFAVEDVNVLLAPFAKPLDEDALRDEVRELLLSPSVLAFPRRGGLLTLEWTLASEVPARLRPRAVPPPAPPGRTYGDYEDSALAVARAILEVARALRLEGLADRLPSLTLVVPRSVGRDPVGRALVREALASAAAAGEPRIVPDAEGLPSRGSRWLRVHPDETGDPLRGDGGDVTVATAGAVNLVAAALRVGAARTEEFLAEIDRLVGLALDAAAARVAFWRGRAERPDGGLFAAPGATRGPIDLEAAFHLVEPVGADRAATLLHPAASPEERQALRTSVVRYLQARSVEEGERRGLLVAVVESPTVEAAERLAEADAARFTRAAGWWSEGEPPSYAPARPAGADPRREPSHPGRGRSTEAHERVRRRVDTDRPPSLDELYGEWERASSDPRVVEYALDPWPRRFVRRPP